ncbi:MAG: type II toxin-antitoxin system HicB family antitoxin [Anaerolineae bacterium]
MNPLLATREAITLPVTIEFLEEDGVYLVSCPLLQGCHAWGDTLDEALRAIPGNFRAMVEARRAKGTLLPEEVRELDLSRPIAIRIVD